MTNVCSCCFSFLSRSNWLSPVSECNWDEDDLVRPKLRERIKISYETPADEVICQAMQEIVSASQSLYMITLRARQVSPPEGWQDELPSWCPYLGVPYMNHPRPDSPDRPDSPEEDTRLRVTDGVANFSTDGKLLHVKGIILGEIRNTLARFPPANHPYENLMFEHTGRLWYEGKYARECIEFIEKPGHDAVDLDRTVLGKAMNGDDNLGLLACLLRRDRLNAPQISQLNGFAKSFHAMQLCTFRCDDLSAYGANNTKMALNGEMFDFAIIPQKARRGDVLCAIRGCEQLMVVRRCHHEQGEFYSVVGEAKVYLQTGHDILSRLDPSRLTLLTIV
ncbi:hypothetical protein BDW59DRAFT_158330 [Aspergillus cavernicola]|uniref:Uncharacterized protein n=1 Tax=Aspergillus cavernicola TaxID=176166 RepID=A0ABR4IT09_9EURO